MPILEWQEKFNTNIPEVDLQHKELVQMLNDLLEAMGDGKGKSIIKEIISRMIYYTQFHFENEEKIMLQNGYPKYKLHLNNHKKFLKNLKRFSSKINSDNISIEIAEFLKNWLYNHILCFDKEFGKFLEFKEFNDLFDKSVNSFAVKDNR